MEPDIRKRCVLYPVKCQMRDGLCRMARQNLTVWRHVQPGCAPTAHASLGVVVVIVRRNIIDDQLPLEVFPGLGHLSRHQLCLFPRRHQGIPVPQGPAVELYRCNLDPSCSHFARQFQRLRQLSGQAAEALPAHRELIEKIHQYGLQTV